MALGPRSNIPNNLPITRHRDTSVENVSSKSSVFTLESPAAKPCIALQLVRQDMVELLTAF